jgi:hypothetical protein
MCRNRSEKSSNAAESIFNITSNCHLTMDDEATEQKRQRKNMLQATNAATVGKARDTHMANTPEVGR